MGTALASYALGKPSALAAIVDDKGGLRVVIEKPWDMHYHVGARERLFVVPGFFCWEPVPYEEWSFVVNLATYHALSTIWKETPGNACGGCTFCCRVLPINALQKPFGVLCRHCVGNGCGIYPRRPEPCRDFKCLWRESQESARPWALNLRPDYCHVMFTDDTIGREQQKPNPDLVEIHPDPLDPDAVNRHPVIGLLMALRGAGKAFKFVEFYYSDHDSRRPR